MWQVLAREGYVDKSRLLNAAADAQRQRAIMAQARAKLALQSGARGVRRSVRGRKERAHETKGER